MVKILAVGGGSGGHVTPVVAVFKELHKIDPEFELSFWCDKKFGPTARSIVASYDPELPVDLIYSGKLRRYHGVSKWYALHPTILLPNIVDMVRVAAGFVQSFFKLLRLRPDVIFMKGGFVCLPVGYAARLLRIPIVIHDSDAHPGLTNRLLAPFAKKIGTGAPLKYYKYPEHIRAKIFQLFSGEATIKDVCQMNFAIGHCFAEACKVLISEHQKPDFI